MTEEKKLITTDDTPVNPHEILPGEDSREHLERLHRLGLLKFTPGCRCGDQGCTACMI